MGDLHPRKLATAALYARPLWCLGAQATARMSRTDEPCEPPVIPYKSRRLWLRGGVKWEADVLPEGI